MGGSSKIRVTAPAGMDALDIAQAVVGPDVLLKAEHVRDKTKSPYRAMSELNSKFDEAYAFMLKRMVAAVIEYIEKHAHGGPILEKADPPRIRRLVTLQDLQAFKKIVQDYHDAFVAGVVHPEALTLAEFQRLVDEGLISQDLKYVMHPQAGQLPPERMQIIDTSYHYGRSLIPVKTFQTQSSTDPGLLDLVTFSATPQAPLTAREQASVQWARQNAALKIQNLGTRVADDLTTAVMEADAQFQREAIREAVASGIERRDTWRSIAQDIGNSTGNWSLDARRIAATETTQAVHEGIAAGLQKHTKEDPKNIMVAKIPAPDACPACKELHLNGSGKPRIFALATLQGHGTNVGRKRAGWKAVVGPTHPWCFPAGALVCTSEGHAPIEDLRVGDLVLTHLGRQRAITRLSSRQFDGNLVVLTCGDQVLEVTPEHPLLTARGWVAAERVEPGDSLFRTPELSEHLGNPEDAPPQNAEERLLGRILPLFARGTVPVPGVRFDNSSEFREPEVGVENPNRELWNAYVTLALKEALDLGFEPGENRALLAGLRRLYLLDAGAPLTPSGVMSKLGEAHSLFRAAFGGRNELLLARIPKHNPAISESECNGGAANPMHLRKVLDTVALAVTTSTFFDWDAFTVRHNVAYRTAIVSSVNHKVFSGLVYNFAVDEDESYVANGFVSHNCHCSLVYVPAGWSFNDEGLLMPDKLQRSFLLDHDLKKAQDMTYTATVPDLGVAIRVGDPKMREAIEAVVAKTPIEVFDKNVGVTLITVDMPRIQNPLEEHDLAYWTANEIRLMHDLAPERIDRVLTHEIGHSLNVYLIGTLGSVAAVRKWHDELFAISKEEGFVSDYAKREPIENAAEVTRLYLYNRKRLVLMFPRQLSFCQKAYSGIFTKLNAQVSSENRTAV